MQYPNFSKDLLYGQNFERKVVEYFRTKFSGKNIQVDFNNGSDRKYYDIVVSKPDAEPIKIECKSDRKSSSTGNIAVEYKFKNEPSGISTTQASILIYELGRTGEVLAMNTNIIKKCIRENLWFRTAEGGDYKNSDLYLFHYEDLKKFTIDLSLIRTFKSLHGLATRL